jgi:hypothetical protein
MTRVDQRDVVCMKILAATNRHPAHPAEAPRRRADVSHTGLSRLTEMVHPTKPVRLQEPAGRPHLVDMRGDREAPRPRTLRLDHPHDQALCGTKGARDRRSPT